MLVVGAVAGGEADLAERVFEAVLLRDLGEPAVIVDPLMGALFDQADH
jgi:tripartite-type tricarboxylate transporter receptor subunit TctC